MVIHRPNPGSQSNRDITSCFCHFTFTSLGGVHSNINILSNNKNISFFIKTLCAHSPDLIPVWFYGVGVVGKVLLEKICVLHLQV